MLLLTDMFMAFAFHCHNHFSFLKSLCIYSTEIEIASERRITCRGSERGRSRVIAEEPDVGLDAITPGSHPEPKADAQPLCHPGAPFATTTFDTSYPGSKNLVGRGFLPNFVFQCCVHQFSLMAPKHLDFFCTFHRLM